ncbi:MAG: hypothetical protein OER96_06375 [Gammaproteobacteria bacterium]|nr:hypothetical protein [Gammaproteobacteria bacterium]
MSFYAQEPQTIGKVLDNAFRLYKASFKEAVLFSFLYASIVSMPEIIFALIPGDVPELGPTATSIYWIVFVIALTIGVVFYNGFFFRMHCVAAEEESSNATALNVGLQKLLPIFIATVFCVIAVLLGLVLLIVPGVILMVSLILYSALIIVDNEKILSSLKRSHKLVWKNWWRTTVVFFVPFIVMVVFSMAIGAIVLLGVGMIMGPFSDSATAFQAHGYQAIILISVLGNTIIYTFTMPLLAAVMLIQTNDLKLRKQGTDLEARIAV